MGKFQDLTGKKFGKLTVLGIDHKEKCKNGSIIFWKCQCECGNLKVVNGNNLKRRLTKSCGCLRTLRVSLLKRTHGLTGTKYYGVWENIKTRCYDTSNSAYERYGGRGITMYPAWINDFKAFYDYVSKLPHFGEKGYSLDRIDNNGNYEPNNVRWTDAKTQARNKRNNIIVEFQGTKMTLAEAAEDSKVSYFTLRDRFYRGDRNERLFRPVQKHK